MAYNKARSKELYLQRRDTILSNNSLKRKRWRIRKDQEIKMLLHIQYVNYQTLPIYERVPEVNENTLWIVRRYCKTCGKELSMLEDLFGNHFGCKKTMEYFNGKL